MVVHRVPLGKYTDIGEAVSSVKKTYYDQYDTELLVTDVITKNGAFVITGVPDEEGEVPDEEFEDEEVEEEHTDEGGSEGETEEDDLKDVIPSPDEEQPEGETEETDLNAMTRFQLEEEAERIGIANADSKEIFPNKGTLIDLIVKIKSST